MSNEALWDTLYWSRKYHLKSDKILASSLVLACLDHVSDPRNDFLRPILSVSDAFYF